MLSNDGCGVRPITLLWPEIQLSSARDFLTHTDKLPAAEKTNDARFESLSLQRKSRVCAAYDEAPPPNHHPSTLPESEKNRLQCSVSRVPQMVETSSISYRSSPACSKSAMHMPSLNDERVPSFLVLNDDG